jgi:thioredoxin-dependent peroxiredoxin
VIREGDQAPDFELPDQDGRPIRLADFRGRRVVLYFYPRANTPGCTRQASGIRDSRPDFEAVDAVVLGISVDPVERVKKFDEDHCLGFPLLADAEGEVAERYGVLVAPKTLGRLVRVAERTTFLIDPDGRVEEAMRKVSARDHDALVLASLRRLSAEEA